MTKPPVDDLDDELEINLRLPSVVAARAIVLATLCRRAYLDLASTEQRGDDPEGERFDLAAWISEQGLDPALTRREHRLLKTRLGKIPSDEVLSASWQVEGLAVLAWTLRLVDEAPGYDEPIDPSSLLVRLPAPWDATQALRTTGIIRGEPEIARERERAELWHWRGEIETLVAEADAREAKEVRLAIREVAEEAHAAGLLLPPAGNDFPVQGRPYRSRAAELRETLAGIAAERLRALNWICGLGLDWDHVPLDV